MCINTLTTATPATAVHTEYVVFGTLVTFALLQLIMHLLIHVVKHHLNRSLYSKRIQCFMEALSS